MTLKKQVRVTSLSVSDHDETQQTNIPERRLLQAMLDRWLKDVILIYKGAGINETEELKNYNPLDWLEDKSNNEWSLNWVLSNLFPDAPKRRERLEVITKQIGEGKPIPEIIGLDATYLMEYSYSETSISFLNRNRSDSLLHIKKSDSTKIH